MDVRSARLVQAGIMAAMLLVFVGSPGVMAEDEDPAVVAVATYTGVAFSEWCVDDGFVLDGCQSPEGVGTISALVVCNEEHQECDLYGFFLRDNWGTVTCTAGSASSEMIIEGPAPEGGCNLIYFNAGAGICEFGVLAATRGGWAGQSFLIDIQAIMACVGILV